MFRRVLEGGLLLFVGCAQQTQIDSRPAAPVASKADVVLQSVDGFSQCIGKPTAFDPSHLLAVDAFAFGQSDADGTVYFPASAHPGDEQFIAFGSAIPDAYYESALTPAGPQAATLHYTTNHWTTSRDVSLSRWCTATNVDHDAVGLFGVSLGALALGAEIDFVIDLPTPAGWSGANGAANVWLDNRGSNFSFTVQNAPALAWLGGSQLYYENVSIENDAVPIAHDMQVRTQSYPEGAAATIALHYLDGNGTELGIAPMQLESTHAGSNRDNDAWLATIPASATGAAFAYYVRAVDATGAIAYDSNGGGNYQITPRRFAIAWSGNFGSFQLEANQFYTGADFGSDLSTSMGCDNGGQDEYGYTTRALQIYIPGITDRKFASVGDMNAIASIVQAELYTNATSSGWGSRPAHFVTQWGNNFIYGIFSYNDFCGVIGSLSGGALHDGTYAYKVRFSTDGGITWYWRGSVDGNDGGDNLAFTFAQGASY